MIVGKDSRLRRLPPELNAKQRLFFDGIRYSIETADLAYSRLRETLLQISGNSGNGVSPGVSNQRAFAAAVQDAWSIVDSLNRLRNLLNEVPNVKKNTPPLRIFRQKTEVVRDLRNGVQHLEGTLQDLAKANLPVWGSLAWVTRQEPNSNSVLSCVLVAGTIQTSSVDLVNLVGKVVDPPVDLVELSAYGYKVNLSDLMKRTEDLTRSLETALETALQELFPGRDIPQAGADFYLDMRIEI
jgi:hypothetical protein